MAELKDHAGAAEHALANTLVDVEGSEQVGASSSSLQNPPFDERYRDSYVLAEGGMGQVLVAKDVQIGRDIALKRMLRDRGDETAGRARFVREARVQGQLEHPAVVPVYDLGVDSHGDAWFTMKRVRGATLGDIIARLRTDDRAATGLYSRRRLLTAFDSVCLAVDFAHSRGVVHRDLKPGNVMLGDFGEVYVLDWGIARILGASDVVITSSRRASPIADATTVGEVVGTIGYMPREQLLGEVDAIGPCTDVWALGAILFELLALEPLRPMQTLAVAIAEIDDELDCRPSRRRPDLAIPPELDSICSRALATDPSQRYPSARELSEALSRFLDGDRDLELRRQLASEHLEIARREAERATAGGTGALGARARAMQEIGRVMALDPTREDAPRALARLLIEPPSEMPPEAKAELDASLRDTIRVASKAGALGMAAWYLFLPFYLWMGIRDWPTTIAVLCLIAMATTFASLGVRWPDRGQTWMVATACASALLVAMLTRVVGPLASAPTLAVGLAVAGTLHPTGLRLPAIVGFVIVSLVVPLALELVGVLAPSYQFHDGIIAVIPHMTALQPLPTIVTLTLTSVGTIVALCIYLMQLRQALRDAQTRLHLHAWHLRQLVPGGAAARTS